MKKVCVGLVAVLILYILFQCLPYSYDPIEQQDFMAIAHRGGAALFPENTVYAFEQSIAMGADAIEVDIRMSKDGVLLSMHDDDISHYTNHKGKVYDYQADELSLFHFGYYFQNEQGNYCYRDVEDTVRKKMIPMRISDMFSSFQHQVSYILEIKEEGERGKECAQKLYQLIIAHGLEKNCYVVSFHKEVMDVFMEINEKGVFMMMDEERAKQFVVANYIGYNRFFYYAMDGLMLPLKKDDITLDDDYLIAKIHAQQKIVFYWCINEEEEIDLLMRKGVDGIISDRIDLLLERKKHIDRYA